jgi:hypothetical protein
VSATVDALVILPILAPTEASVNALTGGGVSMLIHSDSLGKYLGEDSLAYIMSIHQRGDEHKG